MRPYHATCQASILLNMFLHHQAKRTRPRHVYYHVPILLHTYLRSQSALLCLHYVFIILSFPQNKYHRRRECAHTIRFIIYPEYFFSTTTFLPFIIFTIVFIFISILHVATTTLLLTFIEIHVVSISFLFVVKSPNFYIYDVYDDGYFILYCVDKLTPISR